MPPRLRGKWALGITPRNFTWIMKDKLAVCERPGGYGDNHRRVRYRGVERNRLGLNLRAAVINLRRHLNLGLTHTADGWTLAN